MNTYELNFGFRPGNRVFFWLPQKNLEVCECCGHERRFATFRVVKGRVETIEPILDRGGIASTMYGIGFYNTETDEKETTEVLSGRVFGSEEEAKTAYKKFQRDVLHKPQTPEEEALIRAARMTHRVYEIAKTVEESGLYDWSRADEVEGLCKQVYEALLDELPQE
jgi:hypothetical protein